MLDFYRNHAEFAERFGLYHVGSERQRQFISRASRIHPTAVVGDPPQWRGWHGIPLEPEIDPTTEIRAFVTVDAGAERPTRIGPNGLIMASVHIGHDCQIGANVQIAPMTALAGFVTIGDNVKIGMGVVIRPYVTVGDNVHIGMGAVVTRDIPSQDPDGSQPWVGNPAAQMLPGPDRLLPPSLR